MEKKISVVIPTYKRPNLLLKCLTALSSQTIPYNTYEVIVVTDGPDQDTVTLLNSWHQQYQMDLRLLTLPQQKGPASARNIGWLSARANLIAFTDDDCIPANNWLASILARYNGENFIAYTGNTVVPISYPPTDYELNSSKLSEAAFITANCSCTKKALTAVGGFDENFKMAWREDSDLEFKLLQQHIPIVRIEEAKVVHPVRPSTWGISIKEQKKAMYDALLFKKHPLHYQQKIKTSILYEYYSICAATLLIILFLLLGLQNVALFTGIVLLVLIGKFAYQRLQHTRKTFSHIGEMLLTSAIIPFCSLYWRYYGMLKFRKTWVPHETK